MHAVDIYGLSEVMGPGVSQECVESKDGLHIWEDHFYPEVVDPLDGVPLRDGEEGELLFTSLTKEALPVIRYRTRDLTRLLPGSARPGMRRMQKITGRSDDMIILRGVNVFPTQIEEIVLRTPGMSPHFQLVLSTKGRLDALTVRVEARPDTPTERRELAAAELVALGWRVGGPPRAPSARAACPWSRARKCGGVPGVRSTDLLWILRREHVSAAQDDRV